VIDLSNAGQLAGATIELFNILQNDQMQNKPGLIILNKMYIAGYASNSLQIIDHCNV